MAALWLAIFRFKFAVELNQRLGLCVVDRQTMANGLFDVIFALQQRLAGYIVNAFDFRRIEDGVVDATGAFMYTATGHALDDFFVINSDFQHVVDFQTRRQQRFSLRDGTREAVEQYVVAGRQAGPARASPSR